MKIRLGFVSNSSTSSFCIYGCGMDSEKAIKMLIEQGVVTKEEAEESKYDAFDKAAEKFKGIEHYEGEDDYTVYFGVDFISIPNDVVVGEWKKEKTELLKKLFGNDVECGVHEEAWPNY